VKVLDDTLEKDHVKLIVGNVKFAVTSNRMKFELRACEGRGLWVDIGNLHVKAKLLQGLR